VTASPRLLAAAATAALLLSGCGDGPMLAGAAATIGEKRITTEALNAVVTRSLADPSAQQNVGTDKPSFERSVLRRLIDHELVTLTAKRHGASVTPGDVLAARERIATQLGGESGLSTEALKAGIAPQDLNQTISDVALRDALGDKLTEDVDVPAAALAQAYQQNIAQFDRVRSAHILVGSQAQAQSILAQVKAHPDQFAALAAKHSTDPGSKANGGDLGFQGRGSLAKPFENAIFSNKAGSLVVVKTQFGFHVIKVIERRTISLAQATEDLRRNLLGPQRQEAISAELHLTAKQLGVRVNPRFGAWDFEELDVVPAEQGPDSVTKPSPRPSDDAPEVPGLTAP
jgi:hypothetical protein